MPRVAVSTFLALAVGLAAAPAMAQPVVQALPSGESRALNAALARVAANPRDAGALVDAGNAALTMNDVDAAIGFFTRADQVAPGLAAAKAGLAGAYVRREDPFTAIRMFNEAEQTGPLSSALLADRGLAYDLVGDNATAQGYYRQAGPTNDEALRRLALSLAISGDKRGSEAALSPLMTRQDKSAWRTRAFTLAILGEEAQAVQIANATMPATLASSIAPYLRYMRQLTRAQQAAAANLGHFPRASEIGRDDPRMAQYAPPTPRRPQTGADAGLIPAGEPLGTARTAAASGSSRTAQPARADRQAQERQAREEREAKARQERQAMREREERERQARLERSRPRERERPPEPVVAVSTAAAPSSTLAPTALAAAPRPSAPAARPAAPAPATVSAAGPGFALAPAAPPATPPSAPPPSPSFGLAPSASPPATLAGPSFSLAPGASTPSSPPVAKPPAAPPAAAPPPARPPAAPAKPRRLAEAFADLAPPPTVTRAPGSVDIRRITPNKPPEAKPAPPAHPSRVWVQVATGRNKQALAFDWKRMAREDAGVFRGKKPYATAWGQTNRLVTGPFETEAAAGAFLAQLRRADVDGAFLWTSPAGQIVDTLPLGK